MSKRRRAAKDGFVVVDKPVGMTSHDVVAAVRGVLGERRVGHSGTLDPDASGVLIVGVGTATRMLRFLSPLDKTYVGEVVLGTATSTLDASGEVTGQFDMSHVSLDDVRAAAAGFVGEFDQTPPMVSAVKIDGKRLYRLAREGTEVDRPARAVRVERFEVMGTDDPSAFRVEVVCSSGTYVRSLAADVGHALGGGAHLRGLCRTAIGPFGLADAVALNALRRDDVRPPVELVAHLQQVVVDAARREEVAHGRVFDAADLAATGPGPWSIFDGDGQLIAVYESWHSTRMKPAIVLIASTEPLQDRDDSASSDRQHPASSVDPDDEDRAV